MSSQFVNTGFLQEHGLLRQECAPVLTSSMAMIYLEAGVIQGRIDHTQPHLHEHLNCSESTLRLHKARLLAPQLEMPSAQNTTMLVRKSHIAILVELSAFERASDNRSTAVSAGQPIVAQVGRWWVEGSVAIASGKALDAIMDSSRMPFLQVNDARIIGKTAAPARSLLLNREQLHCLLT